MNFDWLPFTTPLIAFSGSSRMRVVLCADLLIIGQRSTQTTKEENLNLSRKL
jgi:hypothetical protein